MTVDYSIPSDIQIILDKLDKSPSFAMSRGGRELFHTNFMAFILEQLTNAANEKTYPQLIKKMLLEKFYGKGSAPKNVLVLREKLHFDLFIIPIDGFDGLTDHPVFGDEDVIYDFSAKSISLVVIEAKLKSIPTKEQLENYSRKLDQTISIELIDDENSSKLLINKSNKIIELNNGFTKEYKRKITFKFKDIQYKCILLAPKAFELNASNWTFLSWLDLLNEPNKQNSLSDEPLAVFIKDYLESTCYTIDLIEEVKKIAFDEKINNQAIEGIVNFCTHDAFKKRRIHDLVGKVVYELLAKHIYGQLKNKNELVYKAFFSNSTPGLQMEFVITDNKKETGIGVQLQGNDYRHYIRRNFTDEINTLSTVATKYKKEWFSKDGNKGKKTKIQENSSVEHFKKFDENRFLYFSRDVGQLTVNQLIEAFKQSLIGDPSDVGNSIDTACKVFHEEIMKNQQNQIKKSAT